MIHLIEDIFTTNERQLILEGIQPLLVEGDSLSMIYFNEKGRFRGRQTHATFHLNLGFKWVHERFIDNIKQQTNLDLEIARSWVNFTNGSQDLNYHTHPHDYSSVYYLKTLPFINSGTMFEKKFVRASQNSMLLFPSDLSHSAPHSLLRYNRNTIALELLRK